MLQERLREIALGEQPAAGRIAVQPKSSAGPHVEDLDHQRVARRARRAPSTGPVRDGRGTARAP